jgi:glycosyltransferase involved in cell wall biosynthesis
MQVVGDRPLRPHFRRLARNLGVWDRIEWLGLLDKERPRLYRKATAFAAPCVLASFGVVLLEAMASGTPVVCADNTARSSAMARPGASCHDAAGLADGIAELLDDPDLLRAPACAGGGRRPEEVGGP